MQPPLSFKLFVVVTGLGLLIWACFFAGRASVQRSRRIFADSISASPTSALELRAPPAAQTVPASHDQEECALDQYTYPAWPTGFNISVNALFVIGQQKSGSTWLWELLGGHPCLISAAQPHYRMGAITTKETYYFTSAKIGTDARELLIPWMGYNQSMAMSDEAAESIGNDWFEHALKAADVGTARSASEYVEHRSFSSPNAKLEMKQQCKQYYLLEATPHSINSPVAARRMKDLFPESKAVAVLKEPALRMHSAYNQFSKPFLQSCSPRRMSPWCPVYRYYQLRLPTFAEAVQQEMEYMRAVGCAFEGDTNTRSWMSCFGCTAMDPWKHKRDNIHIGFHPYIPSAALSMYEPMIKAWTEWFPMEDLQIINYHDLVENQLDIVNRVLRAIGLEEFTTEHMDIINPTNLGFKGAYANASDATNFEGKDAVRQFFKPHNERLNAMLADHAIPWHPFPTDV